MEAFGWESVGERVAPPPKVVDEANLGHSRSSRRRLFRDGRAVKRRRGVGPVGPRLQYKPQDAPSAAPMNGQATHMLERKTVRVRLEKIY